MTGYLLVENLKHKRSFLKKIIWIGPFIALLSSFILMPWYFTTNAYNWWYLLLMPACFSLIAGLMEQREDRKLAYRALLPLDVDLKKIYWSKMLLGLFYLTLTNLIHFLGVFGLQGFVEAGLSPDYSLGNLALASLVLVLTSCWQVPLCFFLTKKWGLVAGVLANTVLSLVFSILLADRSGWIFCPYAWSCRLMIPILHILPNGLLADGQSPLVTGTPILLPCLLSLGLFVLLSALTAKWFSKLEVGA